MTPRGKVDPAAGMVRTVPRFTGLVGYRSVEVRAWGNGWVRVEDTPAERARFAADAIRAAIRYAVQKSRESGRR